MSVHGERDACRWEKQNGGRADAPRGDLNHGVIIIANYSSMI